MSPEMQADVDNLCQYLVYSYIGMNLRYHVQYIMLSI